MKYILKFISGCMTLALISCSDILNHSAGDSVSKSDGNDGFNTASQYIIEKPTGFKIDRWQDIDYYKFTIQKSGLYFFDFNNIPSSITLYISLYDNERTTICTSYGQESSICFGSLCEAGDYYIKLNAGYNNSSNQEMTMLIYRDTVDTFEVNNDYTKASPVSNNTYIHGTIFPNSDVDIYKFTTDSNQIVRFFLDSISSKTTMTLKLLDDEKVELKSAYPLTKDSPMDMAYALRKGTYYIRVYSEYGQYSTVPFRLMFRKDTTDQTEWNNDTANAFQLTIGQSVKAAIYPSGDIDYFKMTLPIDDTVTINVDSISSALQSFQVYVLKNELLVRGNTPYTSNGTTTLKKFLDAGTYYLKVYCNGLFSEGEASFKKYTLTVFLK
jgi:hypothetical protein